MSSRKSQSLGRFLAMGSAALLIQIGGVAVAHQRADVQAQMREVLSGAIAAHAISRADPAQDKRAGSGADAQAFARRLLQGWSLAAAAAARPAQQQHGQAADSGKHPDIQALVRQQLLGA